MKKKMISCILSVVAALSLVFPVNAFADTGVNMYRMYNPNSGEHFYTANTSERNNLGRNGWKYEGIGWVAPSSGSPVYRLYNPNAGDHHYTTSAAERNSLVKKGWRSEGVGWRSGGSVPLYREYNPNANSGTHNYTTSKGENDQLVRAGWRGEGVGWFGIGSGQLLPSIPGYVVLSGTIRTMYYKDLLELQGKYSFYYEGSFTSTPYVTVFILDVPQKIHFRPDGDWDSSPDWMVSMIGLPNDMDYSLYEGEHVIAAFDSDYTGWPTDVELPIGQPVTGNFNILRVL